MADPRKGSPPAFVLMSLCHTRGSTTDISPDEEATIKVASGKNAKERQLSNGIIKLKKPAPKHSKPGNWKDGSLIDG